MSMLNGKHKVHVHDYNPSGGFFKKAGWALKGPGGHVVISSNKLHELLHSKKADIEVDKDVWQNLLHPTNHHEANPLKVELGKEFSEHEKVNKEVAELRSKAVEALHQKPEDAAKYSRQAAQGEMRLAAIDKRIAHLKKLVH